MKSWLNYLIQGGASAIQIANAVSPFLPARYQIAIAAAIAVLQAGAGAAAHHYNPDGTPAAVPYKGA